MDEDDGEGDGLLRLPITKHEFSVLGIDVDRPGADAPIVPINIHSKEPRCWHARTAVDKERRRVVCRDCKVELDPIAVLFDLARQWQKWERQQQAAADAKAYLEALERLKVEQEIGLSAGTWTRGFVVTGRGRSAKVWLVDGGGMTHVRSGFRDVEQAREWAKAHAEKEGLPFHGRHQFGQARPMLQMLNSD